MLKPFSSPSLVQTQLGIEEVALLTSMLEENTAKLSSLKSVARHGSPQECSTIYQRRILIHPLLLPSPPHFIFPRPLLKKPVSQQSGASGIPEDQRCACEEQHADRIKVGPIATFLAAARPASSAPCGLRMLTLETIITSLSHNKLKKQGIVNLAAGLRRNTGLLQLR